MLLLYNARKIINKIKSLLEAQYDTIKLSSDYGYCPATLFLRFLWFLRNASTMEKECHLFYMTTGGQKLVIDMKSLYSRMGNYFKDAKFPTWL